jgi:hypothetical protein
MDNYTSISWIVLVILSTSEKTVNRKLHHRKVGVHGWQPALCEETQLDIVSPASPKKIRPARRLPCTTYPVDLGRLRSIYRPGQKSEKCDLSLENKGFS